MDKENNQNVLNTSLDEPNTSIGSDLDSYSDSDLIIGSQWNNQLIEEIQDLLNLR